MIEQNCYRAQLVKPRVFSRFWALVWACLLGVGILVYLGWYMSKRDKQVYISVRPDGTIQRY